MSSSNMLFVLGLLALLAMSNAGGDHTKGGAHIKGGDHTKAGSEAAQQAVIQEDIIPVPYNFNINTGASYGAKVTHEESGDAEGRVKGFYSLSSPRGTHRVVEYTADDSGFHANIKTSEPNIKTHSPANVLIEAISRKGSDSNVAPVLQASYDLSGKLHSTARLHHSAVLPVAQNPVSNPDSVGTKGGAVVYSVGDSQIREPFAFPVAAAQKREPEATPVENNPDISVVDVAPIAGKGVRRKIKKTLRRKTTSSQINPDGALDQQIGSQNVQQALPDSKRVAPAPDSVKGIKTAPISVSNKAPNSPYFAIDGDELDSGREVFVLDDGTIVDAVDLSKSFGKVTTNSYESGQKADNQNVRLLNRGSVSAVDAAPRGVALKSYIQSTSQTQRERKPVSTSPIADQQQTTFKTQADSVMFGTNADKATGLLGNSVNVPGGPLGSSFSLTENEIQNILSSGGVLEFPSGSPTGVFGTRDSTVTQRQPVLSRKPAVDTRTRSNIQSLSQTTNIRNPGTRISPINQRQTILKSQTSATAAGPSATRGSGTAGNTVVVPGGPRGASFSLTESEIERILLSGGVVEFPTDSGTESFGARDVTVTQRKPILNRNTVAETSPAKLPGTRGGSVIVPGGPGGASFSLTESEIQNILTSGGVLEFPTDSVTGIFGPRNDLLFQRQPPVSQLTGGVALTKSGISEVKVSDVAGDSVIVPGGPAGSSFSLTESEIQKILSSGGVLEFPTDSRTETFGARNVLVTQREPITNRIPEIALKRTNIQSVPQTTRAQRPLIRTSSIDQRKTAFKSQTSSTSSGTASGKGLSVSGGSIVVPGGPGGASFSLTESEIQRILSSGGVLEFPLNSETESFKAKPALTTQNQLTPYKELGGIERVRSNAQSLSSLTTARKPASRITSTVEQKRTSFKSPTSGVTTADSGARVPGVVRDSLVVPGGPGGSSFSLTETEIQKILSSGGVIEFPTDSGVGTINAKDILGTERKPTSSNIPGGVSITRSNVQSVSQASAARKPLTRTSSLDQRRTAFKSQTSVSAINAARGSGIIDGSVQVPGGPGGASFSLTESEIQRILSSGGVLEFPSDTSARPLSTQDLSGQYTPNRRVGGGTLTRSNVQTVSQLSRPRQTVDVRPKLATTPALEHSIVVPGGPAGASFSLTESEINRILSTGGVLEFPSDSLTGAYDVKQPESVVVTPKKPIASTLSRGSITRTSSSVPSFPQTTSVQKPATRISSAVGQTRVSSFTPISSTAETNAVGGRSPGQSIVVSGVPGGPSLTLTETEIENILSSGGIVEIPSDSRARPQGQSYFSGPQTNTQRNTLRPSPVRTGSSDIPFNLRNVGAITDSSSSNTPGQAPIETSFAPKDTFVTQEEIQDSSNFGQPQINHGQEVLQQEEQLHYNESPKFVDSSVNQASIVDGKDNQLKWKVDDILDTPSYIAPFNYRGPQFRPLKYDAGAPVVQEQQRLEQILV